MLSWPSYPNAWSPLRLVVKDAALAVTRSDLHPRPTTVIDCVDSAGCLVRNAPATKQISRKLVADPHTRVVLGAAA